MKKIFEEKVEEMPLILDENEFHEEPASQMILDVN